MADRGSYEVALKSLGRIMRAALESERRLQIRALAAGADTIEAIRAHSALDLAREHRERIAFELRCIEARASGAVSPASAEWLPDASVLRGAGAGENEDVEGDGKQFEDAHSAVPGRRRRTTRTPATDLGHRRALERRFRRSASRRTACGRTARRAVRRRGAVRERPRVRAPAK